MTFQTFPGAAPRLLSASWVVCGSDEVLPSAGLLLRGGRVEKVVQGEGQAKRFAERLDLDWEHFEGHVLAPGWVNAHSHLELSHLLGRIPSAGGFSEWVPQVLRAKAQSTGEEYVQGILEGIQRLLRSGTTLVGDIDSVGHAPAVLADSPIAAVVYREVLDAFDSERTPAALRALDQDRPPQPDGDLGLAPHACFTVTPSLLRGVARAAQDRACPVTIHWAETEAEVLWMREGGGPLAGILGPSPRRSGLDLLEEAGLLGPQTSLVHGNYPERGELERIATRGAHVVHCPGSHAFFGRSAFDLAAYRRAGVSVAIGTDSMASNGDLHMGGEVARLRQNHPELGAREAFHMGTAAGAAALGCPQEAGLLRPGYRADVASYRGEGTSPGEVLDFLTASAPSPNALWVGGRPVSVTPR